MRLMKILGFLAAFGVMVGACGAMKVPEPVPVDNEAIRVGLRELARNINAKVTYQGQEVSGIEGIKALIGKPSQGVKASDAEAARRIWLYDPNEKDKEGKPQPVTAYMSVAKHLNQAALVLFLPYLDQQAKDIVFKNLGLYSKSEPEVINIYIMLMMAGAGWAARLADTNASQDQKTMIKKALKAFLAYFGVRSINPDESLDAHGKEVAANTKPLKEAFEILYNDFLRLDELQRLTWRFDRVPADSNLYKNVQQALRKYPGYDDAKKTTDKKKQQGLQNELIEFSWTGYLDRVKDLVLNQHVPVDSQGIKSAHSSVLEGQGFETALYNAARAGRLDVVNFLLEVGADVNKTVNLEYAVFDSPLRAAVREGHADIVNRLLKVTSVKTNDDCSNVSILELANAKQRAYAQIISDLNQGAVPQLAKVKGPARKPSVSNGPFAPVKKAPKRPGQKKH